MISIVLPISWVWLVAPISIGFFIWIMVEGYREDRKKRAERRKKGWPGRD